MFSSFAYLARLGCVQRPTSLATMHSVKGVQLVILWQMVSSVSISFQCSIVRQSMCMGTISATVCGCVYVVTYCLFCWWAMLDSSTSPCCRQWSTCSVVSMLLASLQYMFCCYQICMARASNHHVSQMPESRSCGHNQYSGRQKSVSKISPCLAEQFVCDDSSI